MSRKSGYTQHQFHRLEDERLFVLKIEPQEWLSNIKLKLKNTELWVCDHLHDDNENQGRAQLLQIELMGDYFSSSEEFNRFITSTKKRPPRDVVNKSLANMGTLKSSRMGSLLSNRKGTLRN